MDHKKRRVGLLVAAVTTGSLMAFAVSGPVGAQLDPGEQDTPEGECEFSGGSWDGEQCIFVDVDCPEEPDRVEELPEECIPEPIDETEPTVPESTTTTTTTPAPPAEVEGLVQQRDPVDVPAAPVAANATAATPAPISLTG